MLTPNFGLTFSKFLLPSSFPSPNSRLRTANNNNQQLSPSNSKPDPKTTTRPHVLSPVWRSHTPLPPFLHFRSTPCRKDHHTHFRPKVTPNPAAQTIPKYQTPLPVLFVSASTTLARTFSSDELERAAVHFTNADTNSGGQSRRDPVTKRAPSSEPQSSSDLSVILYFLW
ncbi:hypothetical protein KY290_005750 [Solanum tuberosum]|uniref:Uncharacterized protein n=1 Tax=Solanum tuberosum TaxID=4113 RepID=A0ABQ7WGW9_SOLTU|nr:hypothetical protein KY290_005750 [Solanum tuberosum]